MSNDVFQPEIKEQKEPAQAPPASSIQPTNQLASLSDAVGFQVPVEAIPLPSEGKLYPPDSSLYNESVLQVKCLTAQEEDLLTSAPLIKNGTVITKLIQACLLNKTVDPDEMLIGDRNALLIGIRVAGYGPHYEAEIKCSSCEEKFDNAFDLGRLPIKRLGAEPVERNKNLFSFELPRSKLPVTFRLMTGKDETEMKQIADARKKLKSQVDNSVTSRLMQSIVSIGGKTDKNEIARSARNLIGQDSLALRKYISKIEPGIDMKQNALCPHCGDTTEVTMPLGIGFFWPDLAD